VQIVSVTMPEPTETDGCPIVHNVTMTIDLRRNNERTQLTLELGAVESVARDRPVAGTEFEVSVGTGPRLGALDQ
jgi:hypothetical protein